VQRVDERPDLGSKLFSKACQNESDNPDRALLIGINNEETVGAFGFERPPWGGWFRAPKSIAPPRPRFRWKRSMLPLELLRRAFLASFPAESPHSAPHPTIMKRYAAFDPPEYQNWEADPALLAEFGEHLARDPERAAIVGELQEPALLAIYRDLVYTRLHDIGLKRWVKQGVISKAWLGTGEEAVTVGNVSALDRSRDYVSPMIRNAGACLMMGMSIADLFRSYLGTSDSPSGGRDLHAGDQSVGVVQPISLMGTNAAVMAGVALSFKNRGEDRVALTWIGDGATKSAACHEGMNFAAVKRLPVVYVIQNNQVALGTRVDQHGAGDLSKWPAMYGLPSWECDGNNVLDVFASTRIAANLCRAGDGPAVVVANTFRMGGHATHDEREARGTFDPALFEHWGRRDPIGLYEAYLMEKGVTIEQLANIEAEVEALVDAGAEEALASKERLPAPEAALYEGISEAGPLHSLDVRPI
jgi:TPP-dependent pyruvate/acetoin dehydrogenase alpha subunit